MQGRLLVSYHLPLKPQEFILQFCAFPSSKPLWSLWPRNWEGNWYWLIHLQECATETLFQSCDKNFHLRQLPVLARLLVCSSDLITSLSSRTSRLRFSAFLSFRCAWILELHFCCPPLFTKCHNYIISSRASLLLSMARGSSQWHTDVQLLRIFKLCFQMLVTISLPSPLTE